ncbi:MFS transporter [Haladaptatus sp. W1]|uniref:MFS transporter n=1 Tax=Haladaptatus sp. W1 TaxID=1897478 RepID=UPI0008498220|nr:MFS transporter [Haladaptatus sp. W1]ODR80920.1 MFS transporter [Haladaptatus sp. W1]
MRLTEYLRARKWSQLFGYFLFISVLAAGYYYNLTFVQLGLIDLGTRIVGLSRFQVSVGMSALALVAFLTAISVGTALDMYGWSRNFNAKLRILWGVIVLQLLLTLAAPYLRTGTAFGAWIILCAVSLGTGMPTTFSLVIDLVPVEDRGWVAAAATACAYFLANVYPLQWRIESFSIVMSAAMAPAVVLLGVFAFRDVAFLDSLKRQHRDPDFGVGRFCRPTAVRTWSYEFWSFILLMFGVYFIDSLGFLRIIETPAYIYTSWQSPDFGIHLLIGGIHVLTAIMAGVLYSNFGRRWLFLVVFGLFGFTHLMYIFDIRAGVGEAPLLMPLFYSGAVSFYTVLNFALWPDMSTPDTIGRHSAIGVGFAGFLATFLSTAVVLYMESTTMPLVNHLNIVDALALLLFFLLLVMVYARRMVMLAHSREQKT